MHPIKFLKEQERRRMNFQNKNSRDFNKTLRQERKHLDKRKSSIEKHYRQRKHVERRDSKVGRTLKKLLSRRGKHFVDAEYAETEAQKERSLANEFARRISDDGPTIEYKDGWIDLPREEKTDDSLFGKSRRMSHRMSVAGTSMLRRMSIGSKTQGSTCASTEQMSQAETVETKQKTPDDKDRKKRSKSMYAFGSKSIKSFKIKKSSTPPVNDRYDNGAFSIW